MWVLIPAPVSVQLIIPIGPIALGKKKVLVLVDDRVSLTRFLIDTNQGSRDACPFTKPNLAVYHSFFKVHNYNFVSIAFLIPYLKGWLVKHVDLPHNPEKICKRLQSSKNIQLYILFTCILGKNFPVCGTTFKDDSHKNGMTTSLLLAS